MNLHTSALALFLANVTSCNVSHSPPPERAAIELHVADSGEHTLRGTLTVRGVTNDVVLFAATTPGARARFELPPGLYSVALNSDCEAAWSAAEPDRNGEAPPACPVAPAPVFVPVMGGQSALLRLALVASHQAECGECTGAAGPDVVAAAFEPPASDNAARTGAKR
jgi:hypothetical protein